jgi:RNA-directed DNA polymerase
VQQIWETIKIQPRYVLDADIARCFDRIHPTALLEKMHTSPHCARPLKEWRKAGVVERDILRPTEDGTPQGGVASPLVANMALHGLEDGVQQAGGPGTQTVNGKKFTHRTYCLRYADDFVVLHNTWEGIQRGTEALQAWLKGMGRALKDAKTRCAHTLEAQEECNGNVGFTFLGLTIRQFPVGTYKSKK